MLVFAAITPHPPFLIPALSEKKGAQKLKKTVEAFKKLEEELYLAHPDTIVVLTAHAPSIADAFAVNITTKCATDYTTFGDLITKETYTGDLPLGTKIKEQARGDGMNAQLVTEETIDHSVGVPLHFLTAHLEGFKVVPVGVSQADTKTHFNFGYVIKHTVMESDKKIAVIASADLSHALTTDSPAGFHADGEEYDKSMCEALQGGGASGLLTWEDSFVANAASCGFKPIVTLMGVLQRVNYTFELLSYEAPIGVGYLVGNFKI